MPNSLSCNPRAARITANICSRRPVRLPAASTLRFCRRVGWGSWRVSHPNPVIIHQINGSRGYDTPFNPLTISIIPPASKPTRTGVRTAWPWESIAKTLAFSPMDL